MTEFILQLKCHFTDEEKDQCVPVIHRIVELANLARRKGLIAVDLECEQEESFFLKTALQLVVDGTDSVIVKQILQNLILAENYTGVELLSRLIMAEGVLAIHHGLAPRIISVTLFSMLGEKHMMLMQDVILNPQDKYKSFSAFLKTVKDNIALPECTAFEDTLLAMPNSSIQHVLRQTDQRLLLMSLHGCGYRLIFKVMDNVSMNQCYELCENWGHFKPVQTEYILRAQKEVLAVVETCKHRGEIVITATV